MAMTYDVIVTNAADATWIRRVKAAMVTAAISISVDTPSTPLDYRRDRQARQVLADPDTWASRCALAVALGFIASDNDLTAGSVTDAEIDTRVAAIWNDYIPV